MLLLSSLMVVTCQNTVYSALFLILSFISASGLLFLLECEFISLLFIVIYVGAIAVLFLFVVMMVDIKTINVRKDYVKYFPFASIVLLILFVEISYIILDTFQFNPYIENQFFQSYSYVNWFNKIDSILENQAVGQVFYTEYVLQFLISGNILLLSIIGAVVLTLNKSATLNSVKKQSKFKQLTRVSKTALYLG